MDFDPSEHEPDEYDPESEFRDPDSDSITIPEVSTDEPSVPAAIQTTFWALVLVIKAGVISISLGVLFLAFGMDRTLSAAFLGGGVVLFAFAIRRYRSVDLTALSADDEQPGEDPNTGTDADTDP